MNENEINELDISDSWKNKFLEIKRAKPLNAKGLILKFENPKELSLWSKINFLAFIFNIIYYGVKGMWKKSLLLLAIHVIIVLVADGLILNFPNIEKIMYMVTPMIIPALCASFVNNDFYRFKVLKEGNFWW